MPYAITAAAVVAGGAMYSANKAGDAADQQVESANRAIDAQGRQLAATRADNVPFLATGTAANKKLAQLLGIGDITPAEGYQWNGGTYASKDALRAAIQDNYFKESGGQDPFNPAVQNAIDGWVKSITSQADTAAAKANPVAATDLSSPLLRRFTQSDLDADPVYQSGLKFGADQGRDAINARALQAGNYDSGATLKALTRFGTDYGSTKANESYNRFTNDQNNIFNRLSGISGTGQVATGQVGAAGANATNAIGASLEGAGNARAAGIVGGANAWGNAASQGVGIYNNYQNNQLLQQLLAQNNSGGQTPYFQYSGYDSGGGSAYG